MGPEFSLSSFDHNRSQHHTNAMCYCCCHHHYHSKTTTVTEVVFLPLLYSAISIHYLLITTNKPQLYTIVVIPLLLLWLPLALLDATTTILLSPSITLHCPYYTYHISSYDKLRTNKMWVKIFVHIVTCLCDFCIE